MTTSKQPKAFYILASLQMWKFFSHFGMRTLLVLYMIEKLGCSDARALGISAVFCGSVEVCGILGGYVADRFLGLKRATTLGSLLLLLGYSGLIIESALFPSLGIIALGAALFNSNITALLGSVYVEGDRRRERGFTLFYMMQNLGALVSSLACGMVATTHGYPAAFALAASGMVLGNLTLLFYRREIKGEEQPLGRETPLLLMGAVLLVGAVMLAMQAEEIAMQLLPVAGIVLFAFFAIRLMRNRLFSKKRLRLLFAYLGALTLFFAAEDQSCSTLLLVAEQTQTVTLFGYPIASSSILMVNPLVILLFASAVTNRTVRYRFALPFTLVAIGFGAICLKGVAGSLYGVMGTVFVISLAELMIGPIVMSYASEVATRGEAGVVMGMIPLAFSLAYLLSGALGKMVVNAGSYQTGFMWLALLMLVGGLFLELLTKGDGNEQHA